MTCPLWALMVQTVLKLVVIPQVQFLDKVMVMPVVGLHGPDSPEAREHSTGAVLGQGYGLVDVVPWSRRCRTPSGGAAVAVHLQGRQHPCDDAKVILLAQTVQNSMEIPRFLWIRCSTSRCARGHPCRDAKVIFMVRTVQKTIEISQLPCIWWLMSLLCSCNRFHKRSWSRQCRICVFSGSSWTRF